MKETVNIKKHPFFREIDWEKMERLEVEPPFKPMVTDGEDVTNFDKMYTEEIIKASRASIALYSKNFPRFDGFTYDQSARFEISSEFEHHSEEKNE